MSRKRQGSVVKADHKLTDFFTRKPPGLSPTRSSQATLASSSSPVKSQKTTNSSKTLNSRSGLPDPEIISVSSNSSKSHISISSDSVVSLAEPPVSAESTVRHQPPRSRSKYKSQHPHMVAPKPPPIRPFPSSQVQVVITSPRKRRPEVEKPKRSNKRKSKFDDDSDVEVPNSVIYVRSPPRPKSLVVKQEPPRSRNKKPRLLSCDADSAELGVLVPSSQSDEDEMNISAPPKVDVADVKENVEKWRVMAIDKPCTSDTAQSSPPQSAYSDADAVEPESVSTSPTSPGFTTPAPVDRPLTPIRENEPPPLPATPLALSAEDKTAQIIAKIKAQAYAEAISSPENQPLPDFNEQLDESSDEDSDMSVSKWKPDLTKIKETRGDPFSSPLTSLPSSPHKSGKGTGTRTYSPSPSPPCTRSRFRMKAASATSRSPAPKPKPVIQEKRESKKPAKVKDPFEALLKEKKVASKRMNAIRVLSNKGSGDDDVKWMDEETAWFNARTGVELSLGVHTPRRSASPTGSDVMKKEDRDRLLGSQRGKAIGDLLASDKEKMGRLDARSRFDGVPFWRRGQEEEDKRMITDSTSLPALPVVNDDPLMKNLKAVVDARSIHQVILMLGTGILATQQARCPILVPWLCRSALTIHDLGLTDAAFSLLLHIWNSGQRVLEGIPMPLVFSTLVRLGADPAVFTALGWPYDPDVGSEIEDASERAAVLYRLVTLVTASARSGAVSSADVPDLVLILNLIAMDPSNPLDSRIELITAMDVVCTRIATDGDISAEIETKTCNKLLDFASNLTLANQAFFVSFLAGGGSRSLRMARWTAYCLLLGESPIRPKFYSNLPPVARVIDLLSSEAEGPFGIHNSTDYEDVGFYTDLLNIVLTDIDDYVNEERSIPQVDTMESPGKRNGKDKPLQIIINLLNRIYGKIVDTRAAHLDRSQTKAALQRLSMRVYYQRRAALGSGERVAKPQNLLSWIK